MKCSAALISILNPDRGEFRSERYFPVIPARHRVRRDTFEVTLDSPQAGRSLFLQVVCRFDFTPDFQNHTGTACLSAINDAPLNIPLFPTIIEGMWDFVSITAPFSCRIDGMVFSLYRAALHIDPFTHEKSAALLVNPGGRDVIMSKNFDGHSQVLDAGFANRSTLAGAL